MIIARELTEILSLAAQQFRVLSILGPRQAGKTTLVRAVFPDHNYVSLEHPESRAFAQSDPKGFLNRYQSPAIFDEIQRVPELISYIQVLVDDNPKKKAQYILTGSHQPELRAKIYQSLAGRTAILKLYPLSISEIRLYDSLYLNKSPSEIIWRGFMPEFFTENLDLNLAYSSYFQTFVERDLRQIINLKNAILFEKFVRLLAGRIGQVLNLESLANDVGVSPKTINKWLSILESSFIIIRLAPFFQNIGKRLIKSPKIYFTDTGLACYLLGLSSAKALERDSLYGLLFENMIILDLLKHFNNQTSQYRLYFYRDQGGYEMDLLVESDRLLWPIEIKASATFQPHMLKNLRYLDQLNIPGMQSGTIVYSGEDLLLSSGTKLRHFSTFADSLSSEHLT